MIGKMRHCVYCYFFILSFVIMHQIKKRKVEEIPENEVEIVRNYEVEILVSNAIDSKILHLKLFNRT